MFTAQLCCQGACTQAQIIRAFGVSKNSVLRSVAKYREEGINGFYGPRRGRGPSVMTAEVIVQAEKLLARSLPQGSRQGTGRQRRHASQSDPAGTRPATDGRAGRRGFLAAIDFQAPVTASDKSTRSDTDAAAGDEMGIACTRPCERVMAALGLLPGGAPRSFSPAETFPTAVCSVLCRPWQRTDCFAIWGSCRCSPAITRSPT